MTTSETVKASILTVLVVAAAIAGLHYLGEELDRVERGLPEGANQGWREHVDVEMRKAAETLNKHTPVMLNDGICFDDLMYLDGGQAIYHFTITPISSKQGIRIPVGRLRQDLLNSLRALERIHPIKLLDVELVLILRYNDGPVAGKVKVSTREI